MKSLFSSNEFILSMEFDVSGFDSFGMESSSMAPLGERSGANAVLVS